MQLVLLRSHHGEHLQLLWVVGWVDALCLELEFPQCAHARQEWVDLLKPALVACNVGWQRRVLDGHDG